VALGKHVPEGFFSLRDLFWPQVFPFPYAARSLIIIASSRRKPA